MLKYIFIPFLLISTLSAEDTSSPRRESAKPFSSFTGKVLKAKVRMRAQPTLDAPVVKELSKGDMLIIVGEADDFYTVLPQEATKAYVFRTYVLDNTVEGSKVNVRLEPSVDSPIIAQLNTGDKVNGTVSSLNSKWLEISMPESTHFYVAKEFIEKVGDPNMMAQMKKRRDDINSLLETTYHVSQQEMSKNYPDIKIDGVLQNYSRIADQSKDFPEQAARAKELHQALQENYLKKKITYLENKASAITQAPSAPVETKTEMTVSAPLVKPAVTTRMTAWNSNEDAIYNEWQKSHPSGTLDNFYKEQQENSTVLSGIVEPYTKRINNKPGDYVLVDSLNHTIVGYLYSNKVNLNDFVGHEVNLKAIERPNNNFAFKAYYILGIDN